MPPGKENLHDVMDLVGLVPAGEACLTVDRRARELSDGQFVAAIVETVALGAVVWTTWRRLGRHGAADVARVRGSGGACQGRGWAGSRSSGPQAG